MIVDWWASVGFLCLRDVGAVEAQSINDEVMVFVSDGRCQSD